MVLVFKTNVGRPYEAVLLRRRLAQLLSTSQINFDLEDCDKVLRVEHDSNVAQWVIRWLKQWGYDCEELV